MTINEKRSTHEERRLGIQMVTLHTTTSINGKLDAKMATLWMYLSRESKYETRVARDNHPADESESSFPRRTQVVVSNEMFDTPSCESTTIAFLYYIPPFRGIHVPGPV